MKEQEYLDNNSSVPETSPLHEQGGLTPEHWQKIQTILLNDNAWKTTFIPYGQDSFTNHRITFTQTTFDKFLGYTQKVTTGEFPPDTEHHRRYLGRRHWSMIADGPTSEWINVPGKIPVLRQIFKGVQLNRIDNEIYAEARNYAKHEQYLTYTLDDFLANVPKWDIHGRLWFDKRWEGYIYEEVDFDITAGSSYTTKPLSEQEIEAILRREWHLKKGDIPDIVGASPVLLEQTVLNIFNENEEIFIQRMRDYAIERLRNADRILLPPWLLHPMFGRREKPIPVAA